MKSCRIEVKSSHALRGTCNGKPEQVPIKEQQADSPKA